MHLTSQNKIKDACMVNDFGWSWTAILKDQWGYLYFHIYKYKKEHILGILSKIWFKLKTLYIKQMICTDKLFPRSTPDIRSVTISGER
jgi:hypothetical protein